MKKDEINTKIEIDAIFGSEYQKDLHMKVLKAMLDAWQTFVHNAHKGNGVGIFIDGPISQLFQPSVMAAILPETKMLKAYYDWCKEHGIEKGSVKRFAKEYGIDL
jgi:GNAT superfamily N-acetyltransferase